MIAFIAPYLGLKRTADAVIEKNSFPVSTYLGNLKEGLEVAEKLEASGKAIFISRGGTAKVIREHLFSQVIEIKVSPFDLLRTFTPYIHDTATKIGIVGFNSLLEPAKAVCESLGVKAKYYKIQDENEIFRKIEEIRKEQIDLVVGDVISVKIAQKYNLKYHLIESSEESVKDAIEKAISIMSNIHLELEKLGRTRAVFDSVKDGIVSVDKNLSIEQFNTQAREFLLGGRREDTLKGRSILDFIRDSDLPEVLSSQKKSYGKLFHIGSSPFVFYSTPILIEGRSEGVVSVFQPVAELQKIESKVRTQLHKKGLTAKYHFEDILSTAPSMMSSLKHAKQYSLTLSNILITGETGTGKELLAQSIHNASSVKDGPFVAVNCSALSPSLLESELFGYAGGAFTGALKSGKTGLFEMAHNGTIFLDEINSMDIQLQARLLRVLQEQEIMRIGDDKVIPISVRVICASNSNLRKEVQKGRMRNDLYYRLSVLEITIPPLQERRNDIIPLFRSFLQSTCRKQHIECPGADLSSSFEKKLMGYAWPGNVRELENLVEKYASLIQIESPGEVESLLMEKISNPGSFCDEPIGEGTLKEIEKKIIRDILDQEEGNISHTASRLGIDRNTLKRKLKEPEC